MRVGIAVEGRSNVTKDNVFVFALSTSSAVECMSALPQGPILITVGIAEYNAQQTKTAAMGPVQRATARRPVEMAKITIAMVLWTKDVLFTTTSMEPKTKTH